MDSDNSTETRKKSTKGERRRKRRRKQQMIVWSIAAVAILGIILYLVNCNDANYSKAPQITSEAEVSALEGYTGKILIQGSLTGTPFTVQDAYKDKDMAATPEIEASFIYTKLNIERLQKVVKNEREVREKNAVPEYEMDYVGTATAKWPKDLNIYGMAVDAGELTIVGLTDYGKVYDTDGEYAELEGIEGPEASVVIIGELENGELTGSVLYVNGTIDEAIHNAASGPKLLLIIWLVLCELAILYLQFYKKWK